MTHVENLVPKAILNFRFPLIAKRCSGNQADMQSKYQQRYLQPRTTFIHYNLIYCINI